MKVSFVCLANSRKHNGRCVAGIRDDGGGWIRPVSRAADGTLAPYQYRLDNGADAALLDLIEIEVAAPRPEAHQPENWILEGNRWRLISKVGPEAAAPLLSNYRVTGPELLGNRGDRVAYSDLRENATSASLALVEPLDVTWIVATSFTGRRQTRARFLLWGQMYNLGITDPSWEQRLSHLEPGRYSRASASVADDEKLLFTISLGEPFNGECYKLVAGVVVMPG